MIVFKYKKEPSSNFVKRPVADVYLKKDSKEWIDFHPYIDSGADLTLIPFSLGKVLGFEIKRDQVQQIAGVRGQVPVIHLRHRMKIGGHEFSAQLAWA